VGQLQSNRCFHRHLIIFGGASFQARKATFRRPSSIRLSSPRFSLPGLPVRQVLGGRASCGLCFLGHCGSLLRFVPDAQAKELPTYKDNDFINDGQKIHIDDENKKMFMEQLRKDVEVGIYSICIRTVVANPSRGLLPLAQWFSPPG